MDIGLLKLTLVIVWMERAHIPATITRKYSVRQYEVNLTQFTQLYDSLYKKVAAAMIFDLF